MSAALDAATATGTVASWYLALVAAVALERVVELVVSKRHVESALLGGGVEHGRRHYPAMVLLHTGLLVGCVAEVLLADRPFVPALGLPMLALVLAAQGLRWWCIATLGGRWTTRVIVLPGAPLVERGPYRWLSHPNYLAVVVEGLALPLVHTAWVTATVFTLLNAVLLLGFRIPVERRALAAAAPERTRA
ncbi:MAG: isoprenylcysteine carboxyl methyltransferase family protein [Actinomycetes bacterium]